MELELSDYHKGDKLKFKTQLLARVIEFYNQCHVEKGRFGTKNDPQCGTPGGERAGEITGIPGTQLATARPTAKGSNYKAGDIKGRLGFDTIPDDAVGDITTRLSEVAGFEEFKGRTDRAVLSEIATHQSENIEDMFETARTIGEDTSNAHSDWYPFVNRWSHDQAAELGMKPEAIMAAAAVLSPSADWANNVAWTQQVAQVIKDEKNLTVAPEWIVAKDISAQAAYKFAQKQHESKNTKLIAEGLEPKPFTTAQPQLGEFDHLVGKRLSDLSPEDAAVAIRGAHESYGKAVHQLGGMAGLGNSKNIATPQSIPNFAKAISILRNPSTENIDVQLGNNHKVRSFFQNMRDPLNTTSADVTVDSHHIGMAIGIPITVTNPIMKRIYDAPKRLVTGLVGTYPITVEATRQATQRINKKYGTNYSPAQVQSITWEAQRALYDKKTPPMQKAIGAARSLYRKGDISKNEMLARVENARLAKYGKTPRNKTLEEIRKGFLGELAKGNGGV